jgi:AraC-like DNA-binding protein
VSDQRQPASILLKPTKIRAYLSAMRARGFSDRVVLAGTGLAAEQLHDPSLLIEARQRERVVLNMLHLTGNPALGLEIGAGTQLVDFGIVAYAQMSAHTLRECVGLWQQYSSAVGTTVPLHVEERNANDWSVVYDAEVPRSPVDLFCIEEMVAMATSLGPALAGREFVIRECTFSYSPPEHRACYERILGCPVRFNAAHVSMRPGSPSLDWPLPGWDPEFHSVCLRHLAQFVRCVGRSRPIASRLSALLLARPAQPPTLQEAARQLGMSDRSLRRRLLQERTSYQALIDAVRRDLAIEYLSVEQRVPKEVGYELGYRSTGAFRRAFKGWTGCTIGEFMSQPEALAGDLPDLAMRCDTGVARVGASSGHGCDGRLTNPLHSLSAAARVGRRASGAASLP